MAEEKLPGFQSEFASRVYNIHRSNTLGRIARGSNAPKLRHDRIERKRMKRLDPPGKRRGDLAG